jgi:hypothetical protein
MDARQVAPPPTDEALLDFDSLFGVAHANAAPRASRPVHTPVSSAADAAVPAAAVPPAANNPMPVLELRARAPTPTLHFGDVMPRVSMTRTLLLRNVASRAQRVEVKGMESRDALHIYPMAMKLEPNSARELMVRWAPTSAGVVLSERLELVMNGASSLECRLRGHCARAGGANPNTKPSAQPAAAAMSAKLAMPTPSNVTVRVKTTAAAPCAVDAAAPPRTPFSPNPNRASANHGAAPPPPPPPSATKPSNFRAFLAERRAAVTSSDGVTPTKYEITISVTSPIRAIHEHAAPIFAAPAASSNKVIAAPVLATQAIALATPAADVWSLVAPPSLLATASELMESHAEAAKRAEAFSQAAVAEANVAAAENARKAVEAEKVAAAMAEKAMPTPEKKTEEGWAVALLTSPLLRASFVAPRAAPKPDAAKEEEADLQVAAEGHSTTAEKAVDADALMQAAHDRAPVAAGRRLKLSKHAASAGPAEASALGAHAVDEFYKEARREKRSSAYEQWINFALSEPSMSSEGGGVGVLGARERQRLSLRELQEQINEAAYRRRTVLLLRNPELRASLRKIEQQVQDGVICVRPSVNLAADVRCDNR